MINHVSIGVREIGRARRFYDAALGPLGYRCLSEGQAVVVDVVAGRKGPEATRVRLA